MARGVSFELPKPDAHGEGHIVEQKVSVSARKYGTCGALGEDGLESLHPWDTRCRLITRTMRNPEARRKATMSHLSIKVRARVPAPSESKWKSKKNQLRLRLPLKLRPISLLLGRALVFPSSSKARNHVVCLPCPQVHLIMSCASNDLRAA